MNLLEAIDLVCLNCVEDTLKDNSCCEKCAVRKTADAVSKQQNYSYYIYQTETRDYAFMPFDFAMKHNFSSYDYNLVYGDFIEENNVNVALNKLWIIFNRDDRPNRLGMRSLSVSDVVVINGKPFYCDSFDWSEIPAERWVKNL